MIWSPPSGVLGRIVAEAEVRVAEARSDPEALGRLQRRAADAATAPSFRDALRGDAVAVIAEVKRRSPSKGEINREISAAAQASAYAAGGAAAISVLTEPANFGGSVDDLRSAREAVSIPLIRKDFHIDEIQLIEARAAGASAALLIARALAPAALSRLFAFARDIGLDVLVEVRNEDELERAVDIGANIIGVNERDLETLEMDAALRERLMPRIPEGIVAVAESGIRDADDVARAASAGADAVLVGSALSASRDPEAGVRALAGVRRSVRIAR